MAATGVHVSFIIFKKNFMGSIDIFSTVNLFAGASQGGSQFDKGGNVKIQGGFANRGVGGGVEVSSGFSVKGSSGSILIASPSAGDEGESGALMLRYRITCFIILSFMLH